MKLLGSTEFDRGMLCAVCLISLFQDIVYGTAEKYAAYILNGGWIDRSITIPIALIFLFLSLYKARKK